MTALQYDEWLGSLLEKPAYSLAGSPEAFSWDCFPNGPAFLGAKVPVGNVSGLLNLQDKGFRVVDTNVQLFRQAEPMAIEIQGIRFAVPQDAESIRKLARTCFFHNRFHRDPDIPDAVASRIKEEWAGNYFSGKRGEWMIVSEERGGIIGFLQLLRRNVDTIVIDLIAVAKRSRSKGLAKAMIAYAAQNCLGRLAAIQVGTQIANSESLALYVGLGFRMLSASYVLHKHIKE